MIGPWNKIGFRQIAFGGGGDSGGNDRDDRPPSNSGGYATSTPPKKEPKAPAAKSFRLDDDDPAPVVYTPPPVAVTPAPAVKEAKPGTPADPIPEGFKPPDGAATSALQTWTNMDTGETWTANTGGWTAPNANWTTNPEKWVRMRTKPSSILTSCSLALQRDASLGGSLQMSFGTMQKAWATKSRPEPRRLRSLFARGLDTGCV
jgi:hypothetical protein